jgi:hypothetical protein
MSSGNLAIVHAQGKALAKNHVTGKTLDGLYEVIRQNRLRRELPWSAR